MAAAISAESGGIMAVAENDGIIAVKLAAYGVAAKNLA